jgi:hypothetical protein
MLLIKNDSKRNDAHVSDVHSGPLNAVIFALLVLRERLMKVATCSSVRKYG